ncbi:MAG TPA: YbhN family protein [Acidimicrobiales bacterium]|nr:YbhN family protein [Acidimicrobiales bacterium]
MTSSEPTDTDRSTGLPDDRSTADAGSARRGSASGGASDDGTEVTLKKRTTKGIRMGVLGLITVVVFIYLVVPLIADARRDVETVSSVNWWMLLAAVGCVMLSLVAYTQLTMVALPGERGSRPISFSTLIRIQLSVKAVTNVVPGGTATGSAVGYRLMTTAGVSGTDTGFALATVGLGSAVILNVLLWIGLLVSIPRSGLQPVYATVAIIGVVAIALVGALVLLLMKGHGPLDRMVRAVARHTPRLTPDAASEVLGRVVDHLRELAARPDVIRRGIIWAVANWLLEAGSLWICLAAFGEHLPVDSLLVAFGIANVLAAIPITPGGLGFVEVGLASTLVGFGVPFQVVTVSVVAYRVAQFWLPVPLGAASYLSLKIWPGGDQTTSRRGRLEELAAEALHRHPSNQKD